MEDNIYRSENAGSYWQCIRGRGFVGTITAIAVSPVISVDGTMFIGIKDRSSFKSIVDENT